MSLTYRQLKKSESKKARDFLFGIYGAKYYGAEKKYFKWLYKNNLKNWFSRQKHNKNKLPIFVFEDSKHKIYALSAFLPFDVKYKKALLKGAWDIEWCSSGEIRGLGRELVTRLVKKLHIYAGFGFNSISAKAYKRLGFCLKDEIPRVVLFLRKSICNKINFHFKKVLKKDKFLATPFYVLQNTKKICSGLITDSINEKKLGPKKNREYFEWRIDNNPYINYKIVSMSTCHNKGIGFIRIEQEKSKNIKIGRIVELLYREHYLSDLFKALINFCNKNKIEIIDFFTNSFEEAKKIKRLLACESIHVFINPNIPYKFQPFEKSKNNSINMVYKLNTTKISKSFFNRFFISSKADANQDLVRSVLTAPSLKKTS